MLDCLLNIVYMLQIVNMNILITYCTDTLQLLFLFFGSKWLSCFKGIMHLFIIYVILFVAAIQLPQSVSTSKPNIVFILADDLGFNDIGYHAVEHHSDMKTPFLDSLAMSGIRLENYYVQPICSPSRSVLMSGRYQIHTGLQHYVILPQQRSGVPLDNILLPEQLNKCGYDTHMVGKWHLGFYKEDYTPWKRGFNSYFGYLTGEEDYYTRWKCGGNACGYDMSSEKGPTNETYGKYSANLFVDKAKEAIDKRNTSQPLFLYVAFQSVHSPVEVPASYEEPFAYIKNNNRRVYGGMVAALDEAVKNITHHLQAAGLWNNTLLIFSTDNGGQTLSGGNNYPLRGRKFTLWEGGIKGVGFVHGKMLNVPNPNVKVNNEMMHISDWFPTIMAVGQCPYVKGTQQLDGFNQWNTILGNSASPRHEILINIDPLFTPLFYNQTPRKSARMGFDTSVHAGIRHGEWKLLTGAQGDDRRVEPPEWKNRGKEIYGENPYTPGMQQRSAKLVQLYNVVYDPYEQFELSDFFPEIVDELLVRLSAYNASSVPVHFPGNDPASDPRLHGGFWTPWVK